jgi:hypothetical protein
MSARPELYSSVPYSNAYPRPRNFTSEINEAEGCVKEHQRDALAARQTSLVPPYDASPSGTTARPWQWPDGAELQPAREGPPGHLRAMSGHKRSTLNGFKPGVLDKAVAQEEAAADLVRAGQPPSTPSLQQQMLVLDAERERVHCRLSQSLSLGSGGGAGGGGDALGESAQGQAKCASSTLDVYPPLKGQYDSPGVGLPDRAQSRWTRPAWQVVEVKRATPRYSRFIPIQPNCHRVGASNQEECARTLRARKQAQPLAPRREHVPTAPAATQIPHQVVAPCYPIQTAPASLARDSNQSWPQVRPTKQPFTPAPRTTIWDQMQRSRIMGGVY